MLTLYDFCKSYIDMGKFILTDTESEFESRCKSYGIFGNGDLDFNLQGGIWLKESEGVRNHYTWQKVYQYIQKEFGNAENQITFW